MQVTAKLNNLRMSPRKVRLVTDLIRGMDALEARAQLRFLNKKASRPVAKLLDSALANAKNNFNIEKENLYIATIFVNQGSVLKRWMPRAFGRAAPIMKRTSHINLILEEKTPSKIKRRKAGTGKKAGREVIPAKEETEERLLESEKPFLTKEKKDRRPFDNSSVSKKKFFSRQTFGNIKKSFRRKSI